MEYTKKLEKNISLYYLYSAFWILLVGPIIVLFFLYKGLSYTEIMVLQSVYAISIVLLEVPTGAISDLLGRKYSLILSSLMFILGLIIYCISSSVYLFLIAEIIFGLGHSLKSGSDTALIYDTLKILKREKEYITICGKGNSYLMLTQIIGSVLSAFLYNINPYLPMILSVILLFISLIIALLFTEVKTFQNEKKPEYIEQIKISFKFIKNHTIIKTIMIYYTFFFIFYRIGFWFYQPYLEATGVKTIYFGLVFSLFNIVSMLSSRFSKELLHITKGWSLLFLSMLLSFSFLLMGFFPILIGFLFILPQQLVRGIQMPFVTKFLNKYIPSNQRSTINSSISLIANLGVSIFFPLIGIAMDHINIINLHLICGFTMIFIIIFFKGYLKKNLSNSSNLNSKKINIGNLK